MAARFTTGPCGLSGSICAKAHYALSEVLWCRLQLGSPYLQLLEFKVVRTLTRAAFGREGRALQGAMKQAASEMPEFYRAAMLP